jgi:putative ABC transport system substrate-binding protein
MRRREFITLLGGAAAAWPLAARAQQGGRMRRVGVLMGGLGVGDTQGRARLAAFQEAFRRLGWIAGQNVQIDVRSAAGNADQFRAYASELVGLGPDVILAGGTPAARTLQQVTRTIPVVFTQVFDPLANELVESLRQPGKNMTGFTLYEHTFAAKWLELLKQLAPHLTRAAFLHDPVNPGWSGILAELMAAAPSLRLQIAPAPVRDAAELERTITGFAGEPNTGLVVMTSPAVQTNRELLIALAARHGLPAVYAYRFFVSEGGLASYGVDDVDFYRRAAGYVDRILKGDKPGDLPVQFPTRYELVINLKTAKELGLDPPITLLARTDEVIE